MKEALLDFLFPRYCCICGVYLSRTPIPHICPDCARKIVFIGESICQRCGYDFGEISTNPSICCPRCQHYTFDFLALRSAVHLNRISRRLIHLLKYRNSAFLAQDIAMIMLQNRNFQTFLNGSLLVPVPLHWRRYFVREYNQSELITRELVKQERSIKMLPLLKRKRYTRPQVGLNANERQSNVQDAFVLNEKILKKANISSDTKIIVFDDVLTTGATLNACCKTLIQNGFESVYAATFAQTIKHQT